MIGHSALGRQARRRDRSHSQARQWLVEALEDRLTPALTNWAQGWEDTLSDHQRHLIEERVNAITTTNSEVEFSTAFSTNPSLAAEPGNALNTQTAQSGPLIGIDQFRADPRFAGLDGKGFSTVIIDTGIDLNHSFFGPDANNNGVSDRIVFHYDFADNDADASDVNGHGSNVASIAVSQDATHKGIAPGADIIALKVFRNAGSGSFGFVEKALQWVVANAGKYNIASVNLSLSDSQNWIVAQQLYGLSDEFAALAAMDVLVIAAAGNEFFTHGSVQGTGYPAADPNVIAVGAVWDANLGARSWSNGARDFTTDKDRVISFSQRHHTLTPIFAPGGGISGANANGGVTTFFGTSQAAPHIAGIAVLAQQMALRDLGRRLHLDEFRTLLQETGKAIIDGDDENDNVGNTGLEFRRVDVAALANAITDMAQGDPLTGFAPVAPLGSGIFTSTTPGTVSPNEVTRFHVELDTNQVLSVAVVPTSSSLRATVRVLGPNLQVLGTHTAAAGGLDALLHSLSIQNAGKYVFEVSGGGTTGDFQLRAILNAVLESEDHDGARNDTRATAQDLGAASQLLADNVRRAAVTGSTSNFVASLTHRDNLFAPNTLRFDFNNVPNPAGAGKIVLRAIGDLSGNTEVLHVRLEGIIEQTLFAQGGLDYQEVVATINLTADQLKTLAADGTISVLVTPSTDVSNLTPQESLTVELDYAATTDYYKIDLQANEVVTVVLTELNGAALALQIEDANGAIVKQGSGVDPTVSGWKVSKSGTYFLRVSGAANTPYSLFVTRNAAFDNEPATPLDISAVQYALGHAQPGDSDTFRFQLLAGQKVLLNTRTPNDGPGQVPNTLDPTLEFLDSAGVRVNNSLLVPKGDIGVGGSDGRNEQIEFRAPVTGTYTVRVGATLGSGDYLLEKTIVDETPTAEAGGPYALDEGTTLQLDGSKSVDPEGQLLHFAWDLDGDGVFGETGATATRGGEVGPRPTFDATNINGPQTLTVTLRVMDGAGNIAMDTAMVTVREIVNLPPVAEAGGPYTVFVGETVQLDGALSIDPEGQLLHFAWDLDGDGIFGETGAAATRGGEVGPRPIFNAAGLQGAQTLFATLRVMDSVGQVVTDTATVNILVKVNEPPIANAGGPYTVIEGGRVQVDGSKSVDPEGNLLHFAWDLDGDGIFAETGTAATRGGEVGPRPNFHATNVDGPATANITLRVTDSAGHVRFSTTQVNILNAAPLVSDAVLPQVAVPGQKLLFQVNWTDPSLNDTTRVFVDWGDGSSEQTVAINEPGRGTTTVNHIFTRTGEFNVLFRLEDEDGGVTLLKHRVQVSTANIQADPVQPGKLALFVGGSLGNDQILVSPATTVGNLQVTLGGTKVAEFALVSLGRIVIFGQAGNDTIEISRDVLLDAQVDGGDGDDILIGGRGNDIILGGAGNDQLFAKNGGRDVLIGGLGIDKLLGTTTVSDPRGDDTLLIGNATIYDAFDLALAQVLAEWRSDRDYLTRVNNLRGGLQDLPKLDAAAFPNDDAVDTLIGGIGTDWFLATMGRDVVQGKISKEVVN